MLTEVRIDVNESRDRVSIPTGAEPTKLRVRTPRANNARCAGARRRRLAQTSDINEAPHTCVYTIHM